MPGARNITRVWIVCATLAAIASPSEAAGGQRGTTAQHAKRRTRARKTLDSAASPVTDPVGARGASEPDELDAVAPASASEVDDAPRDGDGNESRSVEMVAPPEDESAATSGESSRARVTLGVAGGTTYRLIEIPAQGGRRRLDTGFVPAVALELRGSFGGARVWLDVSARYQTSLHTFGTQHATDPTSQVLKTPIRSHRLELGVTPSLSFASSPAGVVGGVFVGYGLRALASVAELRVPRFTEHGPLLRLELDIPVIGNALRLRVAPEAAALLSISRAVRRIGATDALGFTFGGEASLRLQLVEWLQIGVDYRESRVWLHSSLSDPFRDVERYVLVGVQLLQ